MKKSELKTVFDLVEIIDEKPLLIAVGRRVVPIKNVSINGSGIIFNPEVDVVEEKHSDSHEQNEATKRLIVDNTELMQKVEHLQKQLDIAKEEAAKYQSMSKDISRDLTRRCEDICNFIMQEGQEYPSDDQLVYAIREKFAIIDEE